MNNNMMNNKIAINSRILIVDDDPRILDLLRDSLLDLSFEVFTATSALEALKFNFLEIDCIITDIMMPDMNGVEFIESLESQGHRKMLFFITGYTDFSREKLAKLNPRAIIFKPFDVEEAAILVKNHIMRLNK